MIVQVLPKKTVCAFTKTIFCKEIIENRILSEVY